MGATKNQIEKLLKRIEELEKENSRLHETVAFVIHKLYSSRFEKTSSLQMEEQISLFDEIEICKDQTVEDPGLKDIEAYHRKKQKGTKINY